MSENIIFYLVQHYRCAAHVSVLHLYFFTVQKVKVQSSSSDSDSDDSTSTCTEPVATHPLFFNISSITG
jgi:hypothetical protein